jgi:hypothetical protein
MRKFVSSLTCMVLVAFLLRIALILSFQTYDFSAVDSIVFQADHTPEVLHHFPFAFGYETGAVAYSLATGHGFSSPFAGSTGPTAWLAPLYPAMCALVFKIFGCFTLLSAFVILSMNSLFSALTCIPIVRIGELTLGKKVGLWSGWIWAAGVFFMQWPTTWIWEVSLSALLLGMIFLQSLRLSEDGSLPAWSRFGFWWGIAALTNPALLAFLPASAVYPAYRLWKNRRSWLVPAAAAAGVFFLCIAPWLIRNRMVFGKWVFIRSNAPFEFTIGNYHLSNGLGWFGKHPTQNKWEYAKYARMGETGFIAEKKQIAVAFVRQYPREFAQLCATRFVAFWTGSDLITNAWPRWFFWPWSALMFAGLLVALAYRVNGSWLYFWLMLCYPLTYYIVFAQPRYRHPIEPEMLLLGTYFVSSALREIAARFRTANPPGLPRAETAA